jgi:hypothetical protein
LCPLCLCGSPVLHSDSDPIADRTHVVECVPIPLNRPRLLDLILIDEDKHVHSNQAGLRSTTG